MNKDTKNKKYLMYALTVVVLGTVMVARSTVDNFLSNHSSDEALKVRNDFAVVSEEVRKEKNDILEDSVHVNKNEDLQEKQEVAKEERKPEPKQEPKKVVEKAPSEVAKVDMSPITTNQYVVKANDTLSLISQRSNVSINTLRQLNNISSDVILKGQVLTIKSTIDTASKKSNTAVSSRGEREEDLYWLSRIIHAEAQGEPYEGKVAVGNVILNRVKSNLFPNTIEGVVFDKQHGYTQFSPVIDGSIYNNPGADSIQAAKDALNGVSPVGESLYFLNPRKAENFWIIKNRVFYKTIGDHDFYY
ncbi:cell wall hydrolase [Alkaliphilus hydrothermalis]|uniref:N-acetylmuramoyl-L-alanine amidase n=1 Tax=Alkaliphilus hydrothermalis TaxID=1482730 RepID=A0ABS2NQN4_9FIRM|nr:cell wall hydrolase [Alkaliphilus hydrothermalis]MBM7614904.1 N-acetylmuramoyl-L-alanine amidase [Alkaliphilus hydrothermalis]